MLHQSIKVSLIGISWNELRLCIYNPQYVLDNMMSESDIDGLKIFKFYEHPQIRAEI
jgi:hypothetical protein